MKTIKIKVAAALGLFLIINSTFAQRNDRRNDRNDREARDENYDSRDRNNNDNDRRDRNYSDNDRRYNNEYDRDDNDRIRDYERGRSDYRKNPYDYRNLPRDWNRQRSGRFDWYSYDWDNRYDPRFGNRDFYDLYFPWDPSNPYDIRNNRDYYSNRQYWNGGRPNRIVIVPPILRYGHPGYAHRNRNNGRGRAYGRR